MEERFIQAAKGLRILFIAYILTLVGQLFQDRDIAGLPIKGTLDFVALVLIFLALRTARHSHGSLQTAYWANLASIALTLGSILGAVLLANGMAYGLAGLLIRGGLLLMVVTRLAAELFILHGTGKLLEEKGDKRWAWYAGFLWKALLIETAVTAAILLGANIMTLPANPQAFQSIYAVVSLVGGLVGLCLSAFELVLLYHSFQTLHKPAGRAS